MAVLAMKQDTNFIISKMCIIIFLKTKKTSTRDKISSPDYRNEWHVVLQACMVKEKAAGIMWPKMKQQPCVMKRADDVLHVCAWVSMCVWITLWRVTTIRGNDTRKDELGLGLVNTLAVGHTF